MVQKGAIKLHYVGIDEQVYTDQDFILNEVQLFLRQAWCSLKGLSSQGGKVMGLQMMKEWTFFEKEDQVEDMNPRRKKGE